MRRRRPFSALTPAPPGPHKTSWPISSSLNSQQISPFPWSSHSHSQEGAEMLESRLEGLALRAVCVHRSFTTVSRKITTRILSSAG